jgi:hypothetical protein
MRARMIHATPGRDGATASDPMKARSLHTVTILCALLAALAFLAASSAHAQPGPVLLQCTAGFGDTSPGSSYSVPRHLGDWVPFRIRILNAGPDASGTLAVVVHDYSGTATRYEKRIDLPAGAQQAHEILARVVGANKAPAVAFEVDGTRVAEIEVQFSKSAGDQLRLGVVDNEATALNDISSVSVDANDARRPFGAAPAPPQPAPATPPAPYTPYGQPVALPIAPIVFGPGDLPRHWLGYASLDAIVLNDAPLAGLDEAQATALRVWVANGGMLVVSGGADFPGLRRTGLDDLLPVDVVEKRAVASVSGLTSTYGAFEAAGDPLVAIGTARPKCETLLDSDAGPVVAERRFGAGRVRFLAVDPKLTPYRGWAGTPRLWIDLVRPVAERKANHPAYVGLNYSEKMNLLYDLADVRAPLVGYYFLYLIVYLFVLGPLNYAILRFKGRLEFAWVTIPAAVVLFSLGTVVAAHLMRGGSSMMVSVSVEQYFQHDGIGFSRAGLLVVPSAKDVYRVDLDEGAGGMPSLDFGGGGNDEFSFDETDEQPAIVASMNTWDVKSFEILSGGRAEPPARVRLAPGGVEVTNTSGDRLRSATAITRDGVFFVGDLESGASSASGAPEFTVTSFAAWYADKVDPFEDGKRLVGSLGGSQSGGWATPGGAPSDEIFTAGSLTPATLATLERPVLVAIREGAKSVASLSSGARERRLSFVVVYLEEGR